MSSKKSNSQRSGVSITQRATEWAAHFRMRWNGREDLGRELKFLDTSLEEYRTIYAKYAGGKLDDATLLEIGYGARPLRMFWLLSYGMDVWGVNLDRPILRGSLAELLAIANSNGVQRVFKSAVRHFMFDRKEWRGLDAMLKSRGQKGLTIKPERFLVGDAANLTVPDQIEDGVDFIFSEHVFEHVPYDGLDRALKRLGTLLRPTGCALLRPDVFTGLRGGHLPEWYGGQIKARGFDGPCRSEPWEHLRKRRFTANTYLNELKLSDYRELISKYFTVLEERPPNPETAKHFLTPAIREELSGYTEEDLLTGSVTFICGRRTHS